MNKSDIELLIQDLNWQIDSLKDAYLQLKIKQRDWHGVADCAMDIRDLEAKIEILKEVSEIK